MSARTFPPVLDSRSWCRWTSECRLVVTDVTTVDRAFGIAEDLMGEIETAIDRFVPTSELSLLRPGRNAVSPLLGWFLESALAAAGATGGLVDPAARSATVRWTDLGLEADALELPDGADLDLGATGKAAAADLIARRIHRRLGTGVLVSLGGDIATAGEGPRGGWQIDVRDAADDPSCRFSLTPGAAVATSSTLHRGDLGADGRFQHHILDPRTGRSAEGPWRTATVVAATCAEANAAATAAIILGSEAAPWLARRGLPARLVDSSGTVLTCAGFPEEGAR